jgi:hypothetical protein
MEYTKKQKSLLNKLKRDQFYSLYEEELTDSEKDIMQGLVKNSSVVISGGTWSGKVIYTLAKIEDTNK